MDATLLPSRVDYFGEPQYFSGCFDWPRNGVFPLPACGFQSDKLFFVKYKHK